MLRLLLFLACDLNIKVSHKNVHIFFLQLYRFNQMSLSNPNVKSAINFNKWQALSHCKRITRNWDKPH